MSLKSDLYLELSTNAAALIALVSTRIYPDRADQQTAYPYITYQEISNQGVDEFAGTTVLAKTTIQFSIWASDAVSRDNVEIALREYLNGKRTTFGTTFINRIFNTNNVDAPREPNDGSQNTVFGKFMDFDIWYQR